MNPHNNARPLIPSAYQRPIVEVMAEEEKREKDKLTECYGSAWSAAQHCRREG